MKQFFYKCLFAGNVFRELLKAEFRVTAPNIIMRERKLNLLMETRFDV